MKYTEPPQDLDSEKALLYLVLTFQDRFIDVVDKLKASDFYSETHQQIWQAMTQLFIDGKQIDLVMLRDQLKKTNETGVSKAMDAIMEAIDLDTRAYNWESYIKIIKDKSLLRQIITTTKAYTYNAQIDSADPTTLLAELERDLLNIVDASSNARPTEAVGIIKEIEEDLAFTREHGWQGYDTGLAKLDEMTGGLIPTQSWILGGYTGFGKTFFILQILLNVLRQGGKVMLFSLEMDRKTNMLRLLGNIAGLGVLNIMRDRLTEPEEIELKKAQEELSSYKDNLIIYDNVRTVDAMRLKVKKAKVTHGIDVIAVDFIQNIRGGESIYERMAEAAVALQDLAIETKVTSILASQISQAAVGKSNSHSIDFKGAGEIATIADVALWVDKPKHGEKADRLVRVRKTRHNEPGMFNIRLSFPSGRVVQTASGDNKTEKEDTEDVQGQIASEL